MCGVLSVFIPTFKSQSLIYSLDIRYTFNYFAAFLISFFFLNEFGENPRKDLEKTLKFLRVKNKEKAFSKY